MSLRRPSRSSALADQLVPSLTDSQVTSQRTVSSQVISPPLSPPLSPLLRLSASPPTSRSCSALTSLSPLVTVTIVGYGMKRQRYEEVHRAALRWPSHAFSYIGIDNDHEQEADYLGEVSLLLSRLTA